MKDRRSRSVAMVVYNDLSHDARVYREARTLSEAGYAVTVLGMCRPEAPPLRGWECLSVTRLDVGSHSSLRLRYARFWRRAYRHLVRLGPDAIHGHDLDALLPAWLAARALSVPLVYDAHELWTELPSLVGRPVVRGVWRAIAATMVPRADVVITVADGVAEELATRYGVRPVVLRNMPLRSDLPIPIGVRDMIGCGAGVPLLLYQGSLMTGYGVERAIEVMEHLREAHLVIIGTGPLEDALRRQAKRSPSADRITFLPAVPFAELPRYTAAAEVGLFLGHSQGLSLQLSLPNKIFEYIAAGVPFVSTEWPEIARVVRQYGVGYLVRPGASAAESAEGIRQALHDRETLAENCRRARSGLVWESEAGKLVECYGHLPWDAR